MLFNHLTLQIWEYLSLTSRKQILSYYVIQLTHLSTKFISHAQKCQKKKKSLSCLAMLKLTQKLDIGINLLKKSLFAICLIFKICTITSTPIITCQFVRMSSHKTSFFY